ncbi:MAG: XTP/dITP diphosphatase [Velocimicrobium sp.]
MNKLIFATTNEGKMKEIRMILAELDYEIVSLNELNLDITIDENGTTFEENAIIKAKTIMQKTNELVIADDSGLEIDYLEKAPGVYSARYMGEHTSYEKKNQHILNLLKEVPKDKRTARFVSVIACAFPNGKICTTRGTMEGLIGYEVEGKNGFGYDPIFVVPEYGCTTAELSPQIKNTISHRGKALEKMKCILRERGV